MYVLAVVCFNFANSHVLTLCEQFKKNQCEITFFFNNNNNKKKNKKNKKKRKNKTCDRPQRGSLTKFMFGAYNVIVHPLQFCPRFPTF